MLVPFDSLGACTGGLFCGLMIQIIEAIYALNTANIAQLKSVQENLGVLQHE